MKIKIDKELCVGSQDCVETCSKVFKMVENKAVVETGEIPKELEEKCKMASDACPAAAISIEN